jgi:hypothetical protein
MRFSKKVEIFSGRDTKKIKEEINQWFKEHETAKIFKMLQSIVQHHELSTIVITIFYEE